MLDMATAERDWAVVFEDDTLAAEAIRALGGGERARDVSGILLIIFLFRDGEMVLVGSVRNF